MTLYAFNFYFYYYHRRYYIIILDIIVFKYHLTLKMNYYGYNFLIIFLRAFLLIPYFIHLLI